MSTFTYRTFNPSPTDYERALADALFTIMGQRVYDPSAIAAQLNTDAAAISAMTACTGHDA